MLSRAGYDVWMGNYRGNTYSTNHVSLDPAEYEFWKFSWDQMGQYDLPSMLGYVLNHTQASKIQYVGHSMGTTAFMAMSDYHQEIYDKYVRISFWSKPRSPALPSLDLATGKDVTVTILLHSSLHFECWLI